MRFRKMRQTIVLFANADGDEVEFPAILEVDYSFQTHNRMVILGTQNNHHKLMKFMDLGEVKWRIPPRTDDYYETTGTCWIESVGATQGVGLEVDTVQPVGDAKIIEETHTVRHPDVATIRRSVLFLQRPRRWPIGGYKRHRPFGHPRAGRWKRVPRLDLRVRGVMHEFHRDGPSPNSEMELIRVPGVEFEQYKFDPLSADDFIKLSDRAWFTCRALLMFCLRQHIDELVITSSKVGENCITTRAVEILPRDIKNDGADDIAFSDLGIEIYLSKGVDCIVGGGLDAELFHAASFGYADSFRQTSAEGSLTSVTEAIERLITLFEHARGLERGLLTSAEQRKFSKALRTAVLSEGFSSDRKAAIQFAVSGRLNLTLEDRIRRMARSQKRFWSEADLEYLDGLDRMIKIRNDIVHGRKVSSSAQLVVELGRSRAIFEKLYLCFLGCGRAKLSGWPLMALKYHYQE